MYAEIAQSGPLLAAILVSALAGLLSFLSPCILPLVPGYVSYVTGAVGTDLDRGQDTPPPRGDGSSGRTCVAGSATAQRTVRRTPGRVLLGTGLFVAGFTTVFVILSVTVSSLGRALLLQQRTIEIVAGLVIVVLGLGYLGLIPGMERQWQFSRSPAAGLAGAPLLGAVFALSWTPCVSPTLGAVLGLAAVEGSAVRGAVLATAYGLGLGVPFLLFAVGFRRLLGVFTVIRRNSRWVVRIGGAMLVVLGLALVTGVWLDFINWLRAAVGPGEIGI